MTSIGGVSTSTTAFLGEAGTDDIVVAGVKSVLDFEREFGSTQDSSELATAVSLFFANGGSDAWIVAVPEGTPLAKALQRLDTVDTVNVLCLPGVTDKDILAATLAYADRRRAFVVADPVGVEVDATIALAESLSELPGSANGALHFPLLQIALGTRAPSGAVAGMYARLDQARGIWKAPAGGDAVLKGVVAPAVDLAEATVARVHAAAVNPIRTFTTGDVIVWGARTLQGSATSNSDWKYISVRRLALYIEESLDRGIRWAVFEPNDEPLWATLRREISLFLDSLWRFGALQGRTASEAYVVRCGRDTMTQDDIDNGRLTILVGIAPVRPAEFVLIRIDQWRSDSARDFFDGTGKPSQRLCLRHRPLAADRVVLEVAVSGAWTIWREVPDVGKAGPGDQVYSVDRESGEVTFGDGEHGAAPPSGGQNIRATYRYGGGNTD